MRKRKMGMEDAEFLVFDVHPHADIATATDAVREEYGKDYEAIRAAVETVPAESRRAEGMDSFMK